MTDRTIRNKDESRQSAEDRPEHRNSQPAGSISQPGRIVAQRRRGQCDCTDRKAGALVIPQAATFEVQDKVFAYKVVDGKAQSAPVQVTRVNGGQEYIVESGLQPGDVIVAEGVGLFREGTEIKQ